MASRTAEDFKIVAEDGENHEKAADLKKLKDELETQLDEKLFDVMPERGDGSTSEKLRAEIEMLDLMIERSTVGLLDLQVMKEEMEAKEREMEWKMSESMELKRAMEELKRKKSEELMGKGKKALNGWKRKWVLAALTAGAVIVAAVVLVGNVKAKKGNRKLKRE